jgi:hypothetical protein
MLPVPFPNSQVSNKSERVTERAHIGSVENPVFW